MGICTFLVGGLSRVGQNAATGSSTRIGSYISRGCVLFPDLYINPAPRPEETMLIQTLCKRWNRTYFIRSRVHRHIWCDLGDGGLAVPGRHLPIRDTRKG